MPVGVERQTGCVMAWFDGKVSRLFVNRTQQDMMEGAVCPVCSADGMWLMEKDEETLKGGGFLKIVSYENVYRDQVIALVLSIENDEAKVGLTLADQPDLEDIDTPLRCHWRWFLGGDRR